MNSPTPPPVTTASPIASNEIQLLLKVPPAIAEQLQHHLNERTLQDQVVLGFEPDSERQGWFSIEGERHDAELVDLPCILESQKTTDGLTFYKSADIAQLLIVHDSRLSSKRSRELTEGVNVAHSSGITPPTSNIRTRKFRKLRSKEDLQEIETEMFRFLGKTNDEEDIELELFEDEDPESLCRALLQYEEALKEAKDLGEPTPPLPERCKGGTIIPLASSEPTLPSQSNTELGSPEPKNNDDSILSPQEIIAELGEFLIPADSTTEQIKKLKRERRKAEKRLLRKRKKELRAEKKAQRAHEREQNIQNTSLTSPLSRSVTPMPARIALSRSITPIVSPTPTYPASIPPSPALPVPGDSAHNTALFTRQVLVEMSSLQTKVRDLSSRMSSATTQAGKEKLEVQVVECQNQISRLSEQLASLQVATTPSQPSTPAFFSPPPPTY